MAQIALDFTLVDLEGKPFEASSLLGRPTILVLLRHLGCLFCQQHLRELRQFSEEIDRSGGRVVVVSFAPPPHLAGFAAALGHPYLWLSDPDRVSYRAFNVGGSSILNPFSPPGFSSLGVLAPKVHPLTPLSLPSTHLYNLLT